MPQIDFYILDDAHPQTRFITACRLADKGYQSGEKLYIHCDDETQARMMDDLLWSFRDGSFIPHAPHPARADDRSPVHVGSGPHAPENATVLINVGITVPPFISAFKRVLEIIDGDPERRQQGRARYRHYKEQGFPLTDHKL